MANEFKVKKGLIVEGSGGTILDIQGSVGQLFSITDSLTGDLFAVSDISGIPILNVNSSGAVDIDGDLSVTDDVTLSNFGAGYLKTNVNGVVSNTATIPWATVSSTPTTISGYGITDALAIGTTATTAMAGDTAIPSATDILTLLSTNNIVDWTTDQGSTNIHSGNYSNTQLSNAEVIGAIVASSSIDDADKGTIRSNIGAGTSSFNGAYSSLSSIPSTFAPSAHNHDDRYYTETESDIRFLRQDGSGKEWVFEVSDEGNISGNKWYKIATVNNGNGGLHLRGLISNHVEGFAAQKFDIGIVGREGGSGREIEITGQVDILHNASSGSDKCGIRVIQSTSSDPYHKFDVYVRTTRYQMLRIHLTKSGGTSFYTSAANVTTEPAPVSGGNVELDTSTLQEGNYVIDDSTPREIYHEGHKPTYSELGAMAYSNLSGAPTLGTAAAAATGDFATAAQGTTADGALQRTGGTVTGNLVVGDVDVASDRVVKVLADQSYKAGFEAYGDGQGTGYLYVGQSASYGGGISYNGDNSPGFIGGETADNITFFRRNADTNTEVFHYPYSGNDVTFNGKITASGSDSTNWNTAYGWGDHGLSAQDKVDIGNLSGTNTGDQDLSSYITSQRAISSTPTDGATTTAISSDWAFDNVKTAVPANALFTDANTTYSAGAGLDLTGTTFSVETDLRDGITHVGKDTSNFIEFDSSEETITFIVGGNAVAVMESDGDLHIKGDVIAFSGIFNP